MTPSELTGSILKYAQALNPSATIIVYAANITEERAFDDYVDMINADHHDVAATIASLAVWLADDVEAAQEGAT